jgi:Family of unknown function (DUF5880)
MSEEAKETRVQEDDAGAEEQEEDEDSPAPAASAPAAAASSSSSASSSSASLLHGTNIAQVLKSTGPVVTCVLLKHIRHDGKDGKPHAYVSGGHVDKDHKRQVLTELVEQVQIDTTPSKSGVQQILGGPFTFLGQYEEEGVVVMARKELPAHLERESISSLRALCQDHDVDTTGILEKNELVTALLEAQLPINPHNLQPPLDGIVVRGDILIMKIAETEEVLDTTSNDGNDDKDGGDNDKGKTSENNKEVKILSNEEFFLDYTKDEWVAFASRTDVKVPEPEEPDDEDEDEDEHDDDEEEEDVDEGADDDDDDDDDDDGGHDDDDEDNNAAVFNLDEADDEDRHAMLNLVLGEVLRNFRHENGRGPDTRELLELRSQIAKELQVEVTTLESLESSNKRSADAALAEHHSPKKVKFSPDAVRKVAATAAAASDDGDDDSLDDDKKPAAKETEEKTNDGNDEPQPGDDDDDDEDYQPAADKGETKTGPPPGEES